MRTSAALERTSKAWERGHTRSDMKTFLGSPWPSTGPWPSSAGSPQRRSRSSSVQARCGLAALGLVKRPVPRSAMSYVSCRRLSKTHVRLSSRPIVMKSDPPHPPWEAEIAGRKFEKVTLRRARAVRYCATQRVPRNSVWTVRLFRAPKRLRLVAFPDLEHAAMSLPRVRRRPHHVSRCRTSSLCLSHPCVLRSPHSWRCFS